MKLYLMQHGEAMDKAENPERPLTEAGRRNAAKAAAFVAQAGVRIDQIRHSGKCRAAQTAALLAAHLKLSNAVVAVSGLEPNDDVAPMAASLQRETRDVMLVGHLPFLSRLASLLLAGSAECAIIGFANAGVVCLEHDEHGWTVNWMVIPALLA